MNILKQVVRFQVIMFRNAHYDAQLMPEKKKQNI